MTNRPRATPAGSLFDDAYALKAWHTKYVYVLSYALQSKRFVVHALGIKGTYSPPACGTMKAVSLVRRENLNLDNARPCGACQRVLARNAEARDDRG